MNINFVLKANSYTSYSKALSRLLRRGLDTIPFICKRVSLYAYPEKNLIFFSTEAQDPLFSNGRTFVSGINFLNFSGLPLVSYKLQASSQELPALTIVKTLSSKGCNNFFKNIFGNYNLIASLPDNDEIVAFSDFSGMNPLFYATNHSYICVSNRQSLIASVLDDSVRPTLNLFGLSCLLAHSNIWGDQTIFESVKLLEPGSYIEIKVNTGSYEVKDFNWQPWHSYDGSYGQVTPDLFDLAASSVDKYFDSLRQFNFSNFRLSLSGGKDSRVTFGFAIRNNFKSHIKVVTSGQEGNPEVDCASDICFHYDLDHNKVQSALGLMGAVAATEWEDYLNQFQCHLGRNDASLSPTGGYSIPSRQAPDVHISGFGGEFYRKGIRKDFRTNPISSLNDAKARWPNYHVRADALGVMNDWVNSKQRTFMMNWVESSISRGIPISLLSEVFFLKYRMTYLQGIVTNSIATTLTISPILNQIVASIYSKNGDMGTKEQMHFELTRRADKQLAEFPFVRDVWDERLSKENSDISFPKEPYVGKLQSIPQNLRPFLPWNLFELHKEKIHSLFFDAPNSGVFELVDRVKLEKLLGSEEIPQTMVHLNQLGALINTQLYLCGYGIMPKDINFILEESEPKLSTNLPKLELTQGYDWQKLSFPKFRGKKINLDPSFIPRTHKVILTGNSKLSSNSLVVSVKVTNYSNLDLNAVDEYGNTRIFVALVITDKNNPKEKLELRQNLYNSLLKAKEISKFEFNIDLRDLKSSEYYITADLVLEYIYFFKDKGSLYWKSSLKIQQ